MVLYVNIVGPQLIFAQISLSAYSNHNTKLPDLGANQRNWMFPVLQTYQIVFGLTKPLNVTTGKLPSNVRYIYATTSGEVLTRTSRNSGHDVFLMRTPNIRSLNQVVWDQMTA